MSRACSMQGREECAYVFLVGRSEGKRLVGKPEHYWKDNTIKIGLREIG